MVRNLMVVACLAAGLCGLPAWAEDKPAAPVAVKAEDFTRDPDMSPPRISPDGKSLAYVQGNSVVIFDIATEETRSVLGGATDLENVEWINNDYLAAYIGSHEIHGNIELREIGYSPMVIGREGKFIRPLLERDGKVSAPDLRPIVRYIDGPEPYVITLANNNTFLTDVATGKWRVGPRLMDGVLHMFDAKGRERVAVMPTDGKPNEGLTEVTLRYHADDSDRVTVFRPGKRPGIFYLKFNYADRENAFYWTEYDTKTSLATIVRFDMVTGTSAPFRSAANKTLSVVVDEGRVVGVTSINERPQTEWTDPYRVKLTEAVQKIFPNATVFITDMSADNSHVVLWISAPEAPDSYYYYDAGTRQLTQLGMSYPELDGRPMGQMTYVSYKARDGLDIPAYVTKLKDTPKDAPLIVLAHGGPAARDVYGFDYQAQYFAARGYVVLQPQYRGSFGFGEDFRKAGNRNTAKMVTDLEDGVRYLAAQGTIDPKKVCVVGWSWGGYLAQAALTMTPGTYACGVSGAGISNLFDILSGVAWREDAYDYWREVIGEQLRDGDMIHAASPIEHVDAIRAPLLLIHGQFDPVVDYHQSEHMNAAMLKAGKPVTYMPVRFMWHGPGSADQRLQCLKAMDDFIAKALITKALITKAQAPAGKP